MLLSFSYFLCLSVFLSSANVTQFKPLSISGQIVADNQGFDFVLKYIKYLNGIHRFNSFIIISQRYTSLELERTLAESFGKPLIQCGSAHNAKLSNYVDRNSLVIVELKGLSDTLLQTVDYTLEDLRLTTTLFYLSSQGSQKLNAFEMKQFFKWCWHKNMLNTALIYQKSESITSRTYKVHSFTPFPVLKVKDLTLKVQQGGGDFVTDHIRHVNGYEFLAPIATSIPYIFLLKQPLGCQLNAPNCKSILSGTSGRIYREYIHHIGGKINIVHYVNLTSTEYVEKLLMAAARKHADIGVLPLTVLSMQLGSSAISYPIGHTSTCIIVPLSTTDQHKKAAYFQHLFQSENWTWIYLMLFALIILQLGLQLGNTSRVVGFSVNAIFGQSLIIVAALCLRQAHVVGYMANRSTFLRLLHILIVLVTFLLGALYAAALTSFLAGVKPSTPIDNLAQFMASGIQILLTEGLRFVHFEQARLPADLIKTFKMVDRATQNKHKSNLDATYAYIMTTDQWSLMELEQKHLPAPRFHLPATELCSATYAFVLPLQWDSPFETSLNFFILRTQESGLALRWHYMSLDEARQTQLIERWERNRDKWSALATNDFGLVANVIGYLWLLCLICFFGEIFWYRLAGRRAKCWQKVKLWIMSIN